MFICGLHKTANIESTFIPINVKEFHILNNLFSVLLFQSVYAHIFWHTAKYHREDSESATQDCYCFQHLTPIEISFTISSGVATPHFLLTTADMQQCQPDTAFLDSLELELQCHIRKNMQYYDTDFLQLE